MSTLTILGWICTAIGALSLAAIIVVVALAAAYDWQQKRADKPAPQQPATYESSPYGPVRRLCELKGHQYALNADGTHWVCVRGDDRVARLATDLDAIENYANGGAA